MWQHVIEWHVCCVQSETESVSLCTANTHAALQHTGTLPSLYNDVILPSILT